MKGFAALLHRELLSLWVTPLAWGLLTIFLFLQGAIFYTILLHFTSFSDASLDVGPLSSYFGQNSLLLTISLLLLCPALSMRTFAEERKLGTIEVLLAAPVRSLAIVLSKFGAIFLTYIAFWLPTSLYAVSLGTSGSIDFGALITSYWGLFTVGASFLGLGTLFSALCKSQLVALMLTMSLEFAFFLFGLGEYIFMDGLLHDMSAYVSILTFLDEMSRGIVDTRRLVLHLSLTTWALLVAVEVVESWRSEA